MGMGEAETKGETARLKVATRRVKSMLDRSTDRNGVELVLLRI